MQSTKWNHSLETNPNTSRSSAMTCAVERDIEIIGEAMNRILKEDSNIAITNSRKIVDARNYIIHGHDSLSADILWSIVINHLPKLKEEVQSLLEQ